MMTSNKTIEKADIVLDVLLRHDEKDSNIRFRELLDEILTRWKEELQ
jgi:hypothetical protein